MFQRKLIVVFQENLSSLEDEGLGLFVAVEEPQGTICWKTGRLPSAVGGHWEIKSNLSFLRSSAVSG